MNGEMYDDESSPSEAESAAHDTKDTKDDATEDQLALVPSHFFKQQPKPGMREMVEVVEVYENEVSIKCVYGDDDKEENEEREEASAPAAEDEMMV